MEPSIQRTLFNAPLASLDQNGVAFDFDLVGWQSRGRWALDNMTICGEMRIMTGTDKQLVAGAPIYSATCMGTGQT